MKTLVISDVHSNICALEVIWEKDGDADLVVCAGDLVDYGPFPRETIQWIRDHHIPTVQGNHDRSIIRACDSRADLSRMPPERLHWRHHNAQRVGEPEIKFLTALPEALRFEIDGEWYGMSHSYRDYTTIESLQQFDQFRDEAFATEREPTVTRMIFGHTHRQGVHDLGDGKSWINPGSASYRRSDDPDQRAHYAVIIDGQVALRRVEYDISPVYRATQGVELFPHERGMTDWFFGPRNHTMSTRYPE